MLYMPCWVWGWRQHASSALPSWISYNMYRQVVEGDSQGVPTMSRGHLCIWFTANRELRWPIVNQHLRDTHGSFDHSLHISWCNTIRRSTLIVVNDYLLQFFNKNQTIVELGWYTSSLFITKWSKWPKKVGYCLVKNFFQHVSEKKKKRRGSLVMYPTTSCFAPLLVKHTQFGGKKKHQSNEHFWSWMKRLAQHLWLNHLFPLF